MRMELFLVNDLLQLKNSAEIFNFLSDLPSELDEFDILELSSFESLNANTLEQERRKASSQVVHDGSIFSAKTRRIKKRDIRKHEKASRGTAVFKSIFGEFRGPDDIKNKNIRQTGKSSCATLSCKQ
jgi:hypothetical protein